MVKKGVFGWVPTLVDVDQKLATIAISDASTASNGYAGDNAKDVSQDMIQAQAEMAKASGEIGKGQFSAGIEHYGNAWKHAEDAMADAAQNNHDDHGKGNDSQH